VAGLGMLLDYLEDDQQEDKATVQDGGWSGGKQLI